jgi:membrane protein implicated in regulation of membrane protease activity
MRDWWRFILSMVAVCITVFLAVATYGKITWMSILFSICGIIFVFVAIDALRRTEHHNSDQTLAGEPVETELIQVDFLSKKEVGRENLSAQDGSGPSET